MIELYQLLIETWAVWIIVKLQHFQVLQYERLAEDVEEAARLERANALSRLESELVEREKAAKERLAKAVKVLEKSAAETTSRTIIRQGTGEAVKSRKKWEGLGFRFWICFLSYTRFKIQPSRSASAIFFATMITRDFEPIPHKSFKFSMFSQWKKPEIITKWVLEKRCAKSK